MGTNEITINNQKIKYILLFIVLVVMCLYFFLPKTIITKIDSNILQCRCAGITYSLNNSYIKRCIGHVYGCEKWYPVGGIKTDLEDKDTIMELK